MGCISSSRECPAHDLCIELVISSDYPDPHKQHRIGEFRLHCINREPPMREWSPQLQSTQQKRVAILLTIAQLGYAVAHLAGIECVFWSHGDGLACADRQPQTPHR
jgi:hypothetical protein